MVAHVGSKGSPLVFEIPDTSENWTKASLTRNFVKAGRFFRELA